MPPGKSIVVWISLAAAMMTCMAATTHVVGFSTQWVILKKCSVKVNGSTNVSRFTCIVPANPNQDTLRYIVKSNQPTAVTMTGHMEVPVLYFDCANTVMTKTLRKTLKEKEFPDLCIYFLSMERYPSLTAAAESVTGTVNIELAGVTKQIKVHYKISMDSDSTISMTGTQSICFSDFGMVAPRKLGGIIRTSDQVDVEFTIHCRLIN